MTKRMHESGSHELMNLRLVSGVDRGITCLSSTAIEESKLLREVRDVGDAKDVNIPASTAAIARACLWMQHNVGESEGTKDFIASMAEDCNLFAEVLSVAEFLQLTPLVRVQLSSLGAGSGDLDVLLSCIKKLPQLPAMLADHVGVTEAAARALLDKLARAPEQLTYPELEFCDGLHLAAPNRCSLGLLALGARERMSRRRAITAAAKASAEARRKIPERSAEHTAELAVMPPRPMKKAEYSWQPDVYDEASDPVAARRRELEGMARSEALKALDLSLWRAVEAGDLPAARAAHAQGACAELYKESEYNIFPFDEYISAGRWDVDDYFVGLTTLMRAAQKNDLPMMNWLLDVGCDVTAAQPNDYIKGDGYDFGGMQALACVTSVEAADLLLSRGADPNAEYTPPQYESNLDSRPMLVEHMSELRSHPIQRDAIVRCLVRHGADVNACAWPCHDDGQDAGREDRIENAPTAYWPTIVENGDVKWARELLQHYGADPNWPRRRAVKNFGLGASVLQLAVLSGSAPMVRLLLEHGADPNRSEEVWVNVEELENCGQEDHIFFLSDEQRMHYWGKESLVECRDVPPPIKLATPLSVAIGTGNDELVALLKCHGAVGHADNAKTPVRFDFDRK